MRQALGLNASQEHALARCQATEDVRALQIDYASVQVSELEIYDRVMAGPGRTALEDWRRCMEEHGAEVVLPGDDGALMPVEATMAVTSNNRRLAALDVDCKDATDLVERLTREEARLQNLAIAANAEDFERQLAAVQSAVTLAVKIASTAPDGSEP